ncbi:hypothetical protein D9758_015042 [Tetrapyrgos nigripes]|uniref:Uncharacterized protein n=1 Tax=Tetrapyrgos nigripes TaxID=182062 RepID=A0A8H5CT79_9AGAR|nr:hypothetical protein D9758_015042 [Tetrapyrgos nigripes]
MSPTSPIKVEKEDVSIEENAPQHRLDTRLDDEPIPELGTAEREYVERKLVRKLDTRVLPTIILIYIMNYIDPPNTRWMSPFERRLAQARLADDAGEADKDNDADSPLKGLWMALKDPKVLLFSIMTTAQILGISFVNFFPTLTATLNPNFSTTVALLLAAPPWIFATIICSVNAWHADRTGERYFHIAGWWWAAIAGFIIGLSTMNTAGRYVSMFLMASGHVGFAMTLVWVSNTIRGHLQARDAVYTLDLFLVILSYGKLF